MPNTKWPLGLIIARGLLVVFFLYLLVSKFLLSNPVLGRQVADLVSTQVILANNGRELNPLIQNQTVFISTKIGLCIVFYVYARQYPKDKKTMIVFAALSWLPVMHNLMQGFKE